MTEREAIGGAFALVVAGLIAAYMLWPSSERGQASADGPGPNLVIDVDGEANKGRIVIDLLDDVAPKHVERITRLAERGSYNNVVFHRVIDGFMAQTGDVRYGVRGGAEIANAGLGASELPDLMPEFSDVSFERGVVGMARSSSPDSANSQFFIMFQRAPHLNGEYTVVGRVVEGMEVVDAIKKGERNTNGEVENPDFMATVTVER
jgi:peptidylprolyl isomerase